jgi:hypothetical protein
MAKLCSVCGGMIFASNEVAGYSGAVCSGLHPMHHQPIYNDNGSLFLKILELEKRIISLEILTENTLKPKKRSN